MQPPGQGTVQRQHAKTPGYSGRSAALRSHGENNWPKGLTSAADLIPVSIDSRLDLGNALFIAMWIKQVFKSTLQF